MWHSGCFLDATGKRKRAYSKGAILTCKETTRLICEYLEGRLGPGVTRDVTWHLARCKDCRLVLDAARKTLRRSVPENSNWRAFSGGQSLRPAGWLAILKGLPPGA